MYLLFFVSRLRVEGRSKTPVIYLRYKAATDGCEGVDFNEQLLNAFCFPLGPESVQPKEVQASEEYTFTLTHNDGQRFTGFCRQIFPPAPRVGSKARYPQVLCIVAENPWCNFFFKVLQVAEQILKTYDGLLDSAHQDLPLESQLGSFVLDLRKQLATNPAPGEVLRVQVPNLNGLSGVSPPRYMGAATAGEALNWTDDRIELQVPPDCGNGKGNSGIPLARLLFHVPVEGMLTLIASLLLERRIVFVARSRDTVTAAVQAAQALLYPFKWHHIYLPLLPRDLVDYLSAPMPFLVGLTSEMLPLIRHIPMSEVTTVDLDLQKVCAPPGSNDDGRALPYGRQLGAALEAVFRTVRSPTEYESSPLITGVMQEYFVRLFGSYRRFIHDQAVEPLLRSLPSVYSAAGAPPSARTGGGARESARGGRDVRESRGGGSVFASGGDFTPSPQSTNRLHDEMLRGHGYYFDQPSFVAHRRSETVRAFLNAMRHSQLYQMFIQERLEMASTGAIELPACAVPQNFSFTTTCGFRQRSFMSKSSSANNLTYLDRANLSQPGPSDMPSSSAREHASASGGASNPDSAGPGADGPASDLDPFELRVQRYPEQRRLRKERLRSMVAETAPAGGAAGPGRLAGRLRRHRRTDSEDLHSQPHTALPLHGGESMRRITTYPGVLDAGVPPSLSEPASFFLEWDLQEDDGGEESTSPSPSPRVTDPARSPGLVGHHLPTQPAPAQPADREHLRSESGNSLHSADSGEAAPSNSAAALAAVHAAQAASSSRQAIARDREGGGGTGGRDNTPLRRLSVPMLSTNAKSTYMSLRGTPSVESPLAADRGVGGASAVVGPPAPPAVSAGGAGTRMAAAMTNLFSSNGGSAGEAGAAGTVIKDGVQVKILPDGHRVYDGSLKDIMRLAATEAKNGLLSGLQNLTSPLSSPRGPREKETMADRRMRSQIQQQAQQQRQLLAAFSAAAPHQQVSNQPHAQHPNPFLVHGPSPLHSTSSAGGQSSVPLPGMGQGPHLAQCAPPGDRSGGVSVGTAAVAASAAAAGAGGGAARGVVASGAGTDAAAGAGPAAGAGAGAGHAAGPSESISLLGGLNKPAAHGGAVSGAPRSDDVQQHNRLSSILSNIKDKVAGAGTKALGILPTPTYKPQTTGEKAAKFKAQLTGSGASLLAGADGKLKQPHAPQRPLSLTGAHLAPPWARSDVSESAITSGFYGSQPPSVYGTPMASPAAPGTPLNGVAPVEVSPFGPRAYARTQSVTGTAMNPSGHSVNGSAAARAGETTPPSGLGAGDVAGSGSLWREGSQQAAPQPEWDPFGTGSAPPTVGAPSTGAWTFTAANGIATATTSPFAASARTTPPAVAAAAVTAGAVLPASAAAAAACAIAQGAASSSCDASTADLLGITQSAASSSLAAPTAAASSNITFDPFTASDSHAVTGRLESAGSNDFAAFASASSPREFPAAFVG